MRLFDTMDVYLLLVLGLLRAVDASRSVHVREWVATLVASAAYLLSRTKRRRARMALGEFFGPGLGAAQLDRLVHGTFRSFWRDAFLLSKLPVTAKPEEVETAGLEHIRNALSGGCGAILMENSFFGQRNAAKRILRAHGWHAHQTHAPGHLAGFDTHGETILRTRVVRPSFAAREKQAVASILLLPSATQLAFTRQLRELLQANELVFLSGEGQLGHKHTTHRFLGQPRQFATGAINLARFAGAPVLPVFCYRDDREALHCVVESALVFPNDSRAAEVGMRAFAARLEHYVSRYPDQYRNWHSRVGIVPSSGH